MIDTYRNLKQISLVDGKFYNSKDIEQINETKHNIEITTRKSYIIIPKSSISRIEYYGGAGADAQGYRQY